MDERLIDSNPLPDGVGERLADQLSFLAEADRLKGVLRASRLAAVDRRENSAEHSWHLALMVVLLAEHAEEPVDVGHTLTLVVIHDLVEIYAGDSPVFDVTAVADQEEREQAAADRLFAILPDDQAVRIRALWDEYEAGITPESRFGRALDRLQPILLNWLTHGGTWPSFGADETRVGARVAGVAAGSSALGDVAARLMSEGVARGWIAPG